MTKIIDILIVGTISAAGAIYYYFFLRKPKTWEETQSEDPRYTPVEEGDIVATQTDQEISCPAGLSAHQQVSYSWVFSDPQRSKIMKSKGWTYQDTGELVTEKPRYIKHVRWICIP